MWILLIVLLNSNMDPTTMTSIPGYADEVECANAGLAMVKTGDKYIGKHLWTGCIPGPKER
jgi:hypothetical protein